MEAFERFTGAELFLVLERDGPLLEQFRQLAHVLVNRNGVLYSGGRSLRGLLEAVAPPGPELAVCNSAESWQLIRELRYGDRPHVIALVHELLSHYGDEACRILHRNADRIVFPAESVKAAAVRAFPPFRDAGVIPQGLVKPEFGRGDKRAARREVREELGLPADTKIVLGCGTRGPRKGVDLFIQLAARVSSQSTVPVHFVWLGGEAAPTEYNLFLQHDVTLLDLGSRVSFVTETAYPERYFLAADVFALTSRNDPFPCVVHEAMACALPIVIFSGSGGASEAVADGCGIAVPYLDIAAMARCVSSIIERPSDFSAMGEKAEQRVRSVYRFAEYARRILDVRNELEASASHSISIHSPRHSSRDLPAPQSSSVPPSRR
jgi:glycosyltransferase involved in cell wall biosynthesis